MVCSNGVCPYDNLPCERFSDDLGCGVCEVNHRSRDGSVSSDVCRRFCLKRTGCVVEVFAGGAHSG